jgi:glycosyltransferase involved in cell wall biosynthesis
MPTVSVRMVVANFPPLGGGSERQCALLARHLSRLGVAVTVLTRYADGAQGTDDGVKVQRLGQVTGSRWLRGMSFLSALVARLIRDRRDYQVVHCHGFEPLALAGVAAQRALRKRLVIKVVTSGSFGDLARLSRLIGWRAIAGQLAHADAVTVLNTEAAEELARTGVAANKLVHIPNGVEVPPFVNRPTGRNVLYCGRLVAQKNVDGLLRAWARSRAARERVLDVVGDGPERARLVELVRALDVEHSVCFHGRVTDPTTFYRRAAALVLFSHAEGLSNVVLEALAGGVPVIGSDIPGIRELVQHEETGLLVAPGDEAALAVAIDRLLDEPQLAERMSHAGHALVGAHYSIETIAHRVLALYQRLLT